MSANTFRLWVVVVAALVLYGHVMAWVVGWTVLGWQASIFAALMLVAVTAAIKDGR